MRHLASLLVLGLVGLRSSDGLACPFCDAGGTETARFVVFIFGAFAGAAFFIFLAFKKKGFFEQNLNLESSVLAAENLSPPKEKTHDTL